MTGSSDPLEGNHRVRSISPVVLPAGVYTVVSVGHSTSDRHGNSTISGTGTQMNNGGGFITFNSSSFGGAGFGLPVIPFATNNVFHAGTFKYNTNCTGSAHTITVTVTPPVGTPAFTAGSTSARCQGAGTITYGATATKSSGFTYTLYASSMNGGNTINADTGMLTFSAGWYGT